ncbi:NUDIX domain-containing protein [Rhodoplanes serenus]|uniref:NUDIX domain-containing protein n=1 Tax=Rhodoplanes serenus TaxID=200615 RepID=A0A9X4XS81_9BRAD|nr:NUDIX domain-containing protein [Rhodoplanes serenus]MTW18899.1 NUDIX domain-containing protein [Rhodoplanes serenus]
MARMHVLAAGGIVVRHGPAPLVAVVQRRKDRGWVLPKGKLKPDEAPIAAALREAMEETGHEVEVFEFLGVTSHQGRDTLKLSQFWRMQAGDAPVRSPARDIRAVDWLPLVEAVARLSNPHEKAFLGGVGPSAVAAATIGLRARPGITATDAMAELRAMVVEPAAPRDRSATAPSPGLLRRFVQGWTTSRSG